MSNNCTTCRLKGMIVDLSLFLHQSFVAWLKWPKLESNVARIQKVSNLARVQLACCPGQSFLSCSQTDPKCVKPCKSSAWELLGFGVTRIQKVSNLAALPVQDNHVFLWPFSVAWLSLASQNAFQQNRILVETVDSLLQFDHQIIPH